jgi:hypothetical protein
MPLPSSGPISIGDIRDELQTSNGSLGDLSDLAGFSRPDAMSEFYDYSAYTLEYSGLSADSPCNSAIYNIYQNVGDLLYYASDDGGSIYDLAYSISSAYFIYSYYDSFFDAYVYNEYEVNAASSTFTYIGDTLSFCAPS